MNGNDESGVRTAFEDAGTVYYADSCIPLSQAADAGSVLLRALARGHYPGARLPERTVPEIRTLGFWDAQTPQIWGLDWHRNEGIEITYLAHGSAHFSVGSDSWALHAGDVTVTRPWQEHRVGNPNVDASNLHWLILDVGVRRPGQTWKWPDWLALAPADLTRLTTLLQHNEHPVWQGTADLERSFDRVATLVDNPGAPTFESEAQIAVSSIMLELLKVLDSNDVELDASLSAPGRGVELFLRDLDGQLDYRWTVTSMARACNMGRTQFTQLCRDVTNASPMEFLNERRLCRAAALLRDTPMAVTDVAARCGFDTAQYFATRFKARFGCTPTIFRGPVCSTSVAG